MSGWFPIYDTRKGIRGHLECSVEVNFISDLNRFTESSAGVRHLAQSIYFAHMCIFEKQTKQHIHPQDTYTHNATIHHTMQRTISYDAPIHNTPQYTIHYNAPIPTIHHTHTQYTPDANMQYTNTVHHLLLYTNTIHPYPIR